MDASPSTLGPKETGHPQRTGFPLSLREGGHGGGDGGWIDPNSQGPGDFAQGLVQ